MSDWRESRVPNRLVLLGLAAFAGGLVYHLLSSVLGHRGWRLLDIGEYYLPWRFFSMLGVHAILSLIAGWTLWRVDVWPAGDAKLYIVISWLLPLANANLTGFPRLLFIVLLINCFVPPGILFACEGVIRLAAAVPAFFSEGIFRALKSAVSRVVRRIKDLRPMRLEVAALLVNLACLFFVMRLLEAQLHRQPFGALGQLAVFLSMLVVWPRLVVLLYRPRLGAAALCLFFVGAVCAVVAGLDLGAVVWRAAKMMVNFGFALSLARVVFSRVIERSSLRDVAPDELRPGALLADTEWEALSKDEGSRGIVEERNCDGLTRVEAEALRSSLSGRGVRSLCVYRTVPFAAWIFLGTVLTLAHQGTIVSWARSWMAR